MAHEVVNGANGSTTWCSGLGCPRCDADREMNERLRRGEPVTWGTTIVAIGPDRCYCPNCRPDLYPSTATLSGIGCRSGWLRPTSAGANPVLDRILWPHLPAPR